MSPNQKFFTVSVSPTNGLLNQAIRNHLVSVNEVICLIKPCHLLKQRFPTFLAPETSFVEDNFSPGWGWRWGQCRPWGRAGTVAGQSHRPQEGGCARDGQPDSSLEPSSLRAASEAQGPGLPCHGQTWEPPEDQGSSTCVKMLSARLTTGAHVTWFWPMSHIGDRHSWKLPKGSRLTWRWTPCPRALLLPAARRLKATAPQPR